MIGREGSNYWLARGGRCVLAAPEHVRAAKHEEVSEMLRMRLALNEVRDLMDRDEQPKLVDYSDDNVEPSENLELAAENDLEGGVPADASMEVEDERFAQALDEERRIEQATRNHQLTDVVPAVVKRQRAAILSRQASEAAASSGGERDSREVHMAAHRISERGKQKQLEKETSWGQIPPEERQLYRDAELTQWKEHVEFGAVGALSLEESRQVLDTADHSRIFRARFAYRDKNHSMRPRLRQERHGGGCSDGQPPESPGVLADRAG